MDITVKMLTLKRYKLVKAVLSVITQVMIMFVGSQLITTALTSFRWQVKAMAIYNILGGTVEEWWTVSPITIAIEVSLEDIWFIGKLICGGLAFIANRFVKKA